MTSRPMPRTYRPPASRARDEHEPKSLKRSVPTLPRTSAANGVPAPTAQRLRPIFTRVDDARTFPTFALPFLKTTIWSTTGAAAPAGAAATSEVAAAAASTAMRLADTDHQRVRADGAAALRLDEQRAAVVGHDRGHALGVGLGHAADRRALDRLVAVLDVGDLDLERLLQLRRPGAAERKEMLGREHVVRPEDVVTGLDLDLAAAELGRNVVQGRGPELRVGGLVRADAADQEVGERRVVGAVPGDRVVERTRDGRAGGRVGAAVGAVARLRAVLVLLDRVAVGADRALEDRVGCTFDPEGDGGRCCDGARACERESESRQGPDT